VHARVAFLSQLLLMSVPAASEPNPRLFEAAVEATEEAVINSLFAATPTDGNGHHVDALPVDQVVKLYRRARR